MAVTHRQPHAPLLARFHSSLSYKSVEIEKKTIIKIVALSLSLLALISTPKPGGFLRGTSQVHSDGKFDTSQPTKSSGKSIIIKINRFLYWRTTVNAKDDARRPDITYYNAPRQGRISSAGLKGGGDHGVQLNTEGMDDVSIDGDDKPEFISRSEEEQTIMEPSTYPVVSQNEPNITAIEGHLPVPATDPLQELSQEQLTSYLLNRPRGPSLLMPHLPPRPQNPHLLGGVRNLDDDQAFIEYWAELRITRETTPKGLNTWLTSWLPNARYSQTDYFQTTSTPFISKPHVYDVTINLAVKWYLDAFDPWITFQKMKQLWLRLDDLRESSFRITEHGTIDYRSAVEEALRASTWRVGLETLFSLLNEIMFQTWRGYIHAQRAPHIFTAEYHKLLDASQASRSQFQPNPSRIPSGATGELTD